MVFTLLLKETCSRGMVRKSSTISLSFRISRSYTFGVRGDPASVPRGGLQINRRGCLEQVPDLFYFNPHETMG